MANEPDHAPPLQVFLKDNTMNDIDYIIKFEIPQASGVTYDDLKTSSREHNLVFPRNLIFVLRRVIKGENLSHIGRDFGRDHATVLHGIKSLKMAYATEYGRRKTIEQVLSLLSKEDEQAVRDFIGSDKTPCDPNKYKTQKIKEKVGKLRVRLPKVPSGEDPVQFYRSYKHDVVNGIVKSSKNYDNEYKEAYKKRVAEVLDEKISELCTEKR